jgi:beta propeller repeat protein
MITNGEAGGVVTTLKRIGYGVVILGLVFCLTGSAIARCTTTPITNNANNDLHPQIDNGIITWHGSDGSDWEIFMYDIASATTTPITNNANDDAYPQIDNGIITWHGWDGTDDEIFMYDIASATTTPITNNANNDEYPQIDNGIITWHGWDGTDWEIFMYYCRPEAPALTPTGLIALVGLLSTIAAVAIVRKRR